MKKIRLSECLVWAVIGLLLLGLAGCDARQQARRSFLAASAVPGVGIGEFRVGSTRASEIEARLGRADKRESSQGVETSCVQGVCEERPYELTSLSYEAEAIWFECRGPVGQDGLLERLSVTCHDGRCPYSGETDKGSRLGDSRQQVSTAHGRPLGRSHNNWIVFYRSGIGFGFAAKKAGDKWPHPEDKVTSIQILVRNHSNLN